MKHNFASKQVRAVNANFQVRKGDNGTRIVRGYASVFNSDSEDLGGYIEQIRPGAFKDTITQEDVRALSSHKTDVEKVLGRSSAGTLRLGEDDTGLWVEIDLPNTTSGNDIAELIERGDVKEMSFGFYITDSDYDNRSTPPRLYVKKVRLLEVSVVTWPAYTATSIGFRSLGGAEEVKRELAQIEEAAAQVAQAEQQRLQELSRLEAIKLQLDFLRYNNIIL